jgi:GxxExxY protein
MKVHSMLSNGFTHPFNYFRGVRECLAIQEVIYQPALEIKMTLSGIAFKCAYEMRIYYRNEHIGTRRMDFLVEGVVEIELKAMTHLDDLHLAQAINYLEAQNAFIS